MTKLLTVMIISMVPVIELRGAIPYGIALGLNPVAVAIAAILGNLFPAPFLIVYTRKVFEWLRKKIPWTHKLVSKLETRAGKKSDVVIKYGFWGICLLVAIPLPGTGAWTGSLVAALLDMRLKKSIPAIGIGVIISAIIMISLSLIGYLT